MNIISKNSKTGYSINFPVEQTCDRSCPFYKARSCYGLKGRFLFRNVREANESRYALYKTFPNAYFEMLLEELEKLRDKGVTHIRVNGIGDTPDEDWMLMFRVVAKMVPEIQFWVATRKMFWQDATLMPANIIVRYSDGVKGDLTSAVTTEEVPFLTCPATLKRTKNCKACGYTCWSTNVPHIYYMKH